MNTKPSNIYIGVIDFFSVLLPGGLLTFFIKGFFYKNVFGDGRVFSELTNSTNKLIGFLLVSYIIGSLVFAFASFLDFTYDKILRGLFKSNYDLTYKVAQQVHFRHIDTDKKLEELHKLGKISVAEYEEILANPNRIIINTFKWSQHFLLFKKPEALAQVQRVEANSKFFRSLVITFLIIAFLLFLQIKNAEGIVFIILSVLCYYRYGELRFKTTEKAYEMIVTADNLEID